MGIDNYQPIVTFTAELYKRFWVKYSYNIDEEKRYQSFNEFEYVDGVSGLPSKHYL